jgi:hypothetical protein
MAGKKAYYVMSAQDVPADTAARRKKFTALRKTINASNWLSGNAARKFQTAAAVQADIKLPSQPSIKTKPQITTPKAD